MIRKLLLSLLFWVAITGLGHAESIPAFNLDRAIAQSAAVVHGKLDAMGQLHVIEVLKGKFDKTIAVQNGAEAFKQLQAIAKEKTFEVIAFLHEDGNKNWRVFDGHRGTVAFYKDHVYLYTGNGEGPRGGQGFASLTDHNPPAYVAEVRKTLATFQARDRLLAMPRGPERTAKAIAFLLGQPSSSAYFHVWTMARLLGAADGKTILAALKKAERDSDRIILLELVRLVPLDEDAFDHIDGWTNPTHPPALRRAAFAALAAVDPYRTAGHCAFFLRLDEPQLSDLLSQLSTITYLQPHVPKHRNLLEGLVVLTSNMRQSHREGGRQALGNDSYALLAALECYPHPRHLPALMVWALADDHATSNQAMSILRSFTGFKHDRDAQELWNAWFKKAWPVLAREYKLNSAKERNAWLEAYNSSDDATRRLLMTLWDYEVKVDEGALIEAAQGKHGDAAKVVLAHLWKIKRLTPASKQAVVDRFVKVKLVELPLPHPKSPTVRELAIVAERHFPFPQEAWVENRSSIVIGKDHDPKLEGAGGSFSLGGVGPRTVGSMGGGSYPGAPSARALLELREVGGGGRVVWSKRWELGPIMLEKRTDLTKK